MPEPGEVKEGLVWTGTAWVPLRPAGEPSLEAAPSPSAEHVTPASDSQRSTDAPGVNCPICHKNDRMIRIGALVDSRSTRLAQRFETPKPPTSLAMLFVVPAVTIGLLVILNELASTTLKQPFTGLVQISLTLIVGLGVLWWYWRLVRFYMRWNNVGDEVLNEVWRGYHCERDGVAFSEEHPNPALPEDFVDQLYEPYLPRLRDEINAVPLLRFLPSMRRIAAGNLRFTAPPKS